MLYRRFGRTGLSMPVLTCGGMRYQYQWQDMPLEQIPADKQANLEATVRRALELGKMCIRDSKRDYLKGQNGRPCSGC